MEKVEKAERNYGIDALRILAMLMIVILHILGVGGILDACEPMSVQYVTAWFLEAACYCSVNCYALISGYVGLCAPYKYTNICLLWLRVIFYTLSITVLFGIFMPGTVDKTILLKTFFPVMKSPYWYFTAYFGLFFFMPILNKAINNMSKSQTRTVVAIMVFFVSVLQTVFGDVFGTAEGSSVLWLIILYIIGAYIRKFDPLKKLTTGKALIGYLIMTTLSWGLKLAADAMPLLLGDDNEVAMLISAYSDRSIRYISPTMLASAIFLFFMFKRISIPAIAEKVITILSSMTFSVYIVHAHPLVWRNFIRNQFECYGSLSAYVLVIAVLITAVFIFVGSCAFDLVRKYVFKKLQIKERLEVLEKKYIGVLW